MPLCLTGDAASDVLLRANPLALTIGMVLDQQVPFERAFGAPAELERRLGIKLTAKSIAATDPNVLNEAFTRTKALHRFPGAMAERVQRLCQLVVEDYGGDVTNVWSTATSGDELVGRLATLPGFGAQKARVFAALLGKQLGVRPPGWRAACAPYGDAGTCVSIADASSPAALAAVREHKRSAKAAARAKG